MRSSRRAARRRYRSEPATEPAASIIAVTNLRGIAGRIARRAPGGAVRGRRRLDRAQAVLEVVEDEPDRRVRPRRRCDEARPRVVLAPDDEDAALECRRLELREPWQPVRLTE